MDQHQIEGVGRQPATAGVVDVTLPGPMLEVHAQRPHSPIQGAVQSQQACIEQAGGVVQIEVDFDARHRIHELEDRHSSGNVLHIGKLARCKESFLDADKNGRGDSIVEQRLRRIRREENRWKVDVEKERERERTKNNESTDLITCDMQAKIEVRLL